jgi:hypothetical protein
LKDLLVPLAERVPDTFHATWQPENRKVLEDLQQAGRVLNRLQVVLFLLSCLNLALLGLIWLLAVRSPAEWLRWTGVPLLLLGLLVLLFAMLIPQTIDWRLEDATFLAYGDVPTPLAQALRDAITDFVRLLFRPALFAGFALAVPGFLLTLISPLFPGRQRRVR